jgi:pyruvate dehydrogenase E1 component alpha subunit
MCLVRCFEQGVVRAVTRKDIKVAVYLSTGQESVAAAVSVTEARGWLTFTQHRAHDIYLAFGGPPEALRDELLGRPGGTSGGRAGSNCIQYHADGVEMFGHHGFIGENAPLAAGAALGSGRRTLCVFGDGAVEEDYVLATLGFAATKRLPMLFLCIDNDLSILTPTADRRSWSAARVAEAFGLATAESSDDPWELLAHVDDLSRRLPAFLNVKVCRGYWHVGVGVDGAPTWDRFSLVKQALADQGLGADAARIEAETQSDMEALWQAP